jgi:hypothetical protein
MNDRLVAARRPLMQQPHRLADQEAHVKPKLHTGAAVTRRPGSVDLASHQQSRQPGMLAHSPWSRPNAGASTGHSTKMCEYVSRSGAAEQQAAWQVSETHSVPTPQMTSCSAANHAAKPNQKP